MKVPFVDLKYSYKLINKELLEAFTNVLDRGQVVLGEEVKKFEKKYSKFSGTKYCVGVSSGLDAITLSLEALNIQKGSEVIMASNSYIATLNAAVRLGLKPVLVEPKEDTFNIDPANIEKAITAKTKVILPTHFFGQACEMGPILKITRIHKLYVVEDNAQSHGSTYKRKKTGSFGISNATSFYPTKNIGALGEAGAVTTNDLKIYKKISMLRNYGEVSRYKNDIIGYNSRLDEIQAAFLNIKLKKINEMTRKRVKIANIYLKELKNIGDIILPAVEKDVYSVFHIFPIRTRYRDKLREFLTNNGIGTSVHYPIPPHLQKAYSYLGYKKGDFPIAERLAKTSLSIPIYPEIKAEQIEYVIEKIKQYYKNK